jgi:hypothetical protein
VTFETFERRAASVSTSDSASEARASASEARACVSASLVSVSEHRPSAASSASEVEASATASASRSRATALVSAATRAPEASAAARGRHRLGHPGALEVQHGGHLRGHLADHRARLRLGVLLEPLARDGDASLAVALRLRQNFPSLALQLRRRLRLGVARERQRVLQRALQPVHLARLAPDRGAVLDDALRFDHGLRAHRALAEAERRGGLPGVPRVGRARQQQGRATPVPEAVAQQTRQLRVAVRHVAGVVIV